MQQKVDVPFDPPGQLLVRWERVRDSRMAVLAMEQDEFLVTYRPLLFVEWFEPMLIVQLILCWFLIECQFKVTSIPFHGLILVHAHHHDSPVAAAVAWVGLCDDEGLFIVEDIGRCCTNTSVLLKRTVGVGSVATVMADH